MAINIENYNPLHDDNCEEYVLGTILSMKNAIDETRDILDEDCFYNIKHQKIYKAIKELDDKGDDINMISIMPILIKNGENISPIEIVGISNHVFLREIYQYAIRLSELSQKRKIYEMGYYLMQSSSSEVDDVSEILSNTRKKLDTFSDKKSDQYIKLDVSLKRVYDIVKTNISNCERIIGTPTGFNKLDEKGGLQNSDLIIIAGESSQGKTALALSITLNAIEQKKKVAYYSMEMQNQQLTSRLIAMKSGISSSSILYNKLDTKQLESFDVAIGKLLDKNLFYDDRSSSNIDTILSSIRNI